MKNNVASFLAKVADTKSFTGQVSLVMGANIVIAAFGFMTGILSARLLGPTGRGELAAIQTLPSFIAAIAMLGMPEAVVFFSSRKPDKAGELLASAQAIVAAFLIPIYGVSWFLLPVLLKAQNPQVLLAARIYLAGIMIVFASNGIRHQLLRAVGSWKAWNFIRILPNAVWLITLVSSALIFPSMANPVRLSQIFIVGQWFIILLPTWILVQKHLVQPVKINIQHFKPMLRYGLPVALSLIPQTLNLRMDQILMAAFLPPAQLGQYVVAVSWSAATSPILNAVGPVLFPTLGALSDPAKKARLLSAIMPRFGLLVIVITLSISIITPVMIPLLFGEQFRQSVVPAVILVFANAVLSLNTLFTEALKGMGLTGKVLTADLIGLAATMTLLLVLIPRYGITGAAVASLAVYLCVCAILAYFVRSQYKDFHGMD